MTEPITKAELDALHALGYEWFTEDVAPSNAVIEVYRAGFRDGHKSQEPRVFREGDPEPGPEVMAVLDWDGDEWTRDAADWSHFDIKRNWFGLLENYGPVVSIPAAVDYEAIIRADDNRRAAAESAGGAR